MEECLSLYRRKAESICKNSIKIKNCKRDEEVVFFVFCTKLYCLYILFFQSSGANEHTSDHKNESGDSEIWLHDCVFIECIKLNAEEIFFEDDTSPIISFFPILQDFLIDKQSDSVLFLREKKAKDVLPQEKFAFSANSIVYWLVYKIYYE